MNIASVGADLHELHDVVQVRLRNIGTQIQTQTDAATNTETYSGAHAHTQSQTQKQAQIMKQRLTPATARRQKNLF